MLGLVIGFAAGFAAVAIIAREHRIYRAQSEAMASRETTRRLLSYVEHGSR